MLPLPLCGAQGALTLQAGWRWHEVIRPRSSPSSCSATAFFFTSEVKGFVPLHGRDAAAWACVVPFCVPCWTGQGSGGPPMLFAAEVAPSRDPNSQCHFSQSPHAHEHEEGSIVVAFPDAPVASSHRSLKAPPYSLRVRDLGNF